MNTCGRIAKIVAVARTVAEPVELVSHHTRANWTSMLPSREKACPAQIAKKRRAQGLPAPKSPGDVMYCSSLQIEQTIPHQIQYCQYGFSLYQSPNE